MTSSEVVTAALPMGPDTNSLSAAASILHRPPNFLLHAARALSSRSVMPAVYIFSSPQRAHGLVVIPTTLAPRAFRSFGSSHPVMPLTSRTISPPSILQQPIRARSGSSTLTSLSHDLASGSSCPRSRRFPAQS